MCWAGLFTEHPASVGETYLEHQRRAFRVARRLLVAAAAAVVHALFPALLTTQASDRVAEIHDEIHDLSRRGTG